MSNPIPARVRVRTHPPLPSFQAWMIIDPNQSIHTFKQSISDLIPKSEERPKYSPDDLSLESQGFAFLNQCPCSVIDVNRDLIDVKVIEALQPSGNVSKKRRRSGTLQDSIKPSGNPNPPKTSHHLQAVLSTETAQTLKPLPDSTVPQNPVSGAPSASRPTIPPGQGKPQTKARNLRKRKRKSYLRQEGLIPKPLSVNPKNRVEVPPTNPSDPSSRANRGVKSEISRTTSTDGSESVSQKQVPTARSSPSSSSVESSTESSCDSSSDSESASSSDADSGSESQSESSAPSSVPIKKTTGPSHPRSFDTTSLQQTVVPVVQDSQLQMLSLSNKNKRKNLRQPPKPSFAKKIIFSTSDDLNQAPHSPTYTPASPTFNYSDLPAAPARVEPCWVQTPVISAPGTPKHANGTGPAHGPPPSMRDPSLIPSNVIITWVDVEDPNWYAGQINTLSSVHEAEAGPSFTPQAPTSKKKRNQNRKKQAKRNKRAQMSRERLQGAEASVPDGEEDEDEDELDEEDLSEDMVDDEIEAAYADFIGTGGHGRAVDRKPPVTKDGLSQACDKWDTLAPMTPQDAKVGDRIGLKVMELSLETFTPELITYYGTLTSTSPTSLTINVDPSCMPEPAPCFEAEEENEVDARELIRAQQRDALMQDRWGECESSRDWEWAAITEVRRLGLSEFET